MAIVALRPSRSLAAPTGWVLTAFAVVAPLAVVYAALYLSASIARPLSDLGGLGYNVARLALSSALCLAPLAVWPFRVRAYAWLAGLGLTLLAALNLVHVVEYSELVTLGAIDATVSTSQREAQEFLTGRPAGLVGAVVGTVLCLAAVAGGAWRIPPELRLTLPARAVAAVLGVAGVVALLAAPMRLFPVSTVKNAVDYVQYRASFEEAREARAAHTFGATAVTA